MVWRQRLGSLLPVTMESLLGSLLATVTTICTAVLTGELAGRCLTLRAFTFKRTTATGAPRPLITPTGFQQPWRAQRAGQLPSRSWRQLSTYGGGGGG